MINTPARRIVGSLRDLGNGTGAVRMEDVYDTDIDDLWSAVTDPQRLARWLVEVEGDVRVGGSIHVRFTSSWTGPGRIDVCEAPRRVLVTLDSNTDVATELEATLSTEGDKTRLVIEERGIPLAELAGHGAGWQAHVEDLRAYLLGRASGGWHPRWTALRPDYERLARDLIRVP